MPPPPEPDPNDEPGPAAVAHENLTADPSGAEWDEDRMRAARPRAIRLNPDGTRVSDEVPGQPEPTDVQ